MSFPSTRERSSIAAVARESTKNHRDADATPSAEDSGSTISSCRRGSVAPGVNPRHESAPGTGLDSISVSECLARSNKSGPTTTTSQMNVVSSSCAHPSSSQRRLSLSGTMKKVKVTRNRRRRKFCLYPDCPRLVRRVQRYVSPTPSATLQTPMLPDSGSDCGSNLDSESESDSDAGCPCSGSHVGPSRSESGSESESDSLGSESDSGSDAESDLDMNADSSDSSVEPDSGRGSRFGSSASSGLEGRHMKRKRADGFTAPSGSIHDKVGQPCASTARNNSPSSPALLLRSPLDVVQPEKKVKTMFGACYVVSSEREEAPFWWLNEPSWVQGSATGSPTGGSAFGPTLSKRDRKRKSVEEFLSSVPSLSKTAAVEDDELATNPCFARQLSDILTDEEALTHRIDLVKFGMAKRIRRQAVLTPRMEQQALERKENIDKQEAAGIEKLANRWTQLEQEKENARSTNQARRKAQRLR